MRTRFRIVVWGILASAAFAVTAYGRQADMDLTKAPRISQEEFKKLAAERRVVIVDVRDADSYKSGHIPGAILIPLDQVSSPEHVKELAAAGKPIVTYCA